MPRRRIMNYMMRDGRNPYGSAGGYISRTRPRGRDRAMNEDMARGRSRDYNYGNNANSSDYAEYNRGQYNRDYAEYDMGRYPMDYEQHRQYGRDFNYEQDMHYGRGKYQPIEAMGYFTGYYGGDDYARGGRGRGRDYGYDYGYDYAGDYGENLTKEELEHWRKKLEKEVGDEQSKNFFKKENIEQRAKQMGIEMKHFNAEELALASYMIYSDYCKSIKPYVGNNMDIYIKMGEEFLTDPDSAVKGGEKLALYYEIVSGEDD